MLNDTQLGEHKVKLLGVVLSEETGFLISEEKVGGWWRVLACLGLKSV